MREFTILKANKSIETNFTIKEKMKNLNQIIIYLTALSIIPIALYINFFIFNIQLWNYEIKAWLIFSALLILINLLTTLSIRLFLNKILRKLNKNYIDDSILLKYLNNSAIAYLLGNVFWAIPVFRLKMWYILPLFQILIIYLFSTAFINKHFVIKSKLPFLKRLYTAEKTEKKINTNKFYVFIAVTIAFYFTVSLFSLYILKSNYKPLNKSLEYYMQGTGFKPVFKDR